MRPNLFDKFLFTKRIKTPNVSNLFTAKAGVLKKLDYKSRYGLCDMLLVTQANVFAPKQLLQRA